MEDRSPVEIETPRLLLTIPPANAALRVVAYYQSNRYHFDPWNPPYPRDFFTQEYWQEQLLRYRQEFVDGVSLRLMLFRLGEVDGPVLGHCNFSQFVRNAFQACYLGYSLDHHLVGQGLMSEALGAAIPYVFETLGLHRIMANYIPTNERSAKLLRRLGFAVEGYARDYLYINGAWRDHILTALTNPSGHPPKI